MYATIDGLIEYLGDDPGVGAGRKLIDLERRMLAYIAPRRVPGGADETAFAQAVYAQYAHEASPAAQQIMAAPAGIGGFTVGRFSATLSQRPPSLFPAGLAPAAHACLLGSGLLYRGVSAC